MTEPREALREIARQVLAEQHTTNESIADSASFHVGVGVGISAMENAVYALFPTLAPSLDEGLLARAIRAWLGDDGLLSGPQAEFVAREYAALAAQENPA